MVFAFSEYGLEPERAQSAGECFYFGYWFGCYYWWQLLGRNYQLNWQRSWG